MWDGHGKTKPPEIVPPETVLLLNISFTPKREKSKHPINSDI